MSTSIIYHRTSVGAGATTSTLPSQQPPPPPLDYDSLLTLFTHRHTSTLFKRQSGAFRQIIREKTASGGLTMNDLVPVTRLVRMGLERIGNVKEEGLDVIIFTKPLCSLIRLFGLPYIKSRSYEEFEHEQALANVLSLLCEALEFDDMEMIHAVCQTVKAWSSHNKKQHTLLKEYHFRISLLNQSNIVSSLILCLQRNAEDLSIAFPLVSVLRHIATLPGREIRTQQFTSEVYEILVGLLEKRTFREPLVSEVVQLLWIMLGEEDIEEQAEKEDLGATWKGVVKKKKKKQQSMTQTLSSFGASFLSSTSTNTATTTTNTESTLTTSLTSLTSIRSFISLRSITVLSSLLLSSFQLGYRLADKQIRNDIMILLVLVAKDEEAKKWIDQTGILKELIIHATQWEMRVMSYSNNNNNELTNSAGGSGGYTTTSYVPKHYHPPPHNKATVGLQKIRDLRQTASSATMTTSVNGGLNGTTTLSSTSLLIKPPVSSQPASYTNTSDIGEKLGDFDLKLYTFSLIALCMNDLSCATTVVEDGNRTLQAALLWLDTAAEWNKRMNGEVPSSTTSASAASNLLTSLPHLSFPALLQLYSSLLSLLTHIIPYTSQRFLELRGIERVVGFAEEIMKGVSMGVDQSSVTQNGVAVVAAAATTTLSATAATITTSPSSSEKHHHSSVLQSLQSKAIHLLARALYVIKKQKGEQIDGSVGVNGGVKQGFNSTQDLTFTGTTTQSLQDIPTSTTEFVNPELQALLSMEGDEAFESMKDEKSQASAGSQPQQHHNLTIPSSSIISSLLTLFSNPSSPSSLRSDAISCISLLAERNPLIQKVVRKEGGIQKMVEFLKGDVGGVVNGGGGMNTTQLNMTSGSINSTVSTSTTSTTPTGTDPLSRLLTYSTTSPTLLLSVIDCLWSSIIGVRTSEDMFLALNGLDATLDLLCIAPEVQQKQLLGFIADLLSNQASWRFVVEWRSLPGRVLPNGVVKREESVPSAGASGAGGVNPTRSPMSPPLSSFGFDRVGSRVGGQSRHMHQPSSTNAPSSHNTVHRGEGFNALDLILAFWDDGNEVKVMEQTELIDTTVQDEENSDDSGNEEENYGMKKQPRKSATTSSVSPFSSSPSLAHLRSSIYSIFSTLGGFSPSTNPLYSYATSYQLAQLHAISQYLILLKSEALEQVAAQLAQEGIQLIPEDQSFIQDNTKQREAVLQSSTSFMKSSLLSAATSSATEVSRYLTSITSRKQQNESFLISNAKRQKKQLFRRRLMYKKMREQMLLKSQVEVEQAEKEKERMRSVKSPEKLNSVGEEKQQMNGEDDATTTAATDEKDDDELEQRLMREIDGGGSNGVTIGNGNGSDLDNDDEIDAPPSQHQDDFSPSSFSEKQQEQKSQYTHAPISSPKAGRIQHHSISISTDLRGGGGASLKDRSIVNGALSPPSAGSFTRFPSITAKSPKSPMSSKKRA